MDRRMGAERGGLLRRFLADIRAAERLAEVPLFQNSYSEAEVESEIVVDLGAEMRLRLKSNTLHPPLRTAGGIDWERLERVMILWIELILIILLLFS